jgi:O-Antigen ligase
MGARRAADVLLLAVLLTATWHRVAWQPFGRVTLADLLALPCIVAVALTRPRIPREARTLALIGAGLIAVYLLGAIFTAERGQLAKGLVVFSLWFGVAVAAVVHLTARGRPFYGRALRWFVAGFVVNAAYGIVQYVLGTRFDVNLDRYLIEPFFPGAVANGLNLYATVAVTHADGTVVREPVYRITALTNDPNHIGILLTIPILIVLAMATAAARRTALLLASLAVGLTIALALSQSRSGLVGLIAGLLFLALTLRTRLVRGPLMWPAITAGALAAVAILTRLDYWRGVLDKRLNPDTPGSSIHAKIYGTIPDVLANHPLVGLGLNTFAGYYRQVSGRVGFGPHSLYVQALTETGLLGATGVLVLLGFVAHCLRRAWVAGDQALAAGLGAAVVATLAANVFYLTTIYPSWYALLALSIAAASTKTASS